MFQFKKSIYNRFHLKEVQQIEHAFIDYAKIDLSKNYDNVL